MGFDYFVDSEQMKNKKFLVPSSGGKEGRDKMHAFLGHYDLRIYLSNTAYIDVGRGSIVAASRIKYVPDVIGCVGTIGQFCDFAECQLFGGGEHRNELPVNVTFTGVLAFSASIKQNGVKNLRVRDTKPFAIGNAVVVSADAKIMSGAIIGDGTVIAANALVAGVLESFSIYGGLPAKKIKNRFDEITKNTIAKVRWWDFDTVYLGQNLVRLQELAVDTVARHIYRKPTPRFVLKVMENKGSNLHQVGILGFLDGDRQRPLADAPPKVRDYINQLNGPEPYQWVANIWD